MTEAAARFEGSIPEAYERYLGPLLFEPFAVDLAARLPLRSPTRVLELACGTGRLTRHLLGRLGPADRLVATDLNQPMIDWARSRIESRPQLEWQQADAAALPFGPGEFDVVACQFGLMFVPDKARAAAEAFRVLRPGGSALFSLWDALELNPIPQLADRVIGEFFPQDPPDFYQVPFHFHDPGQIQALLATAGFCDIAVEPVGRELEGPSAAQAALGLIQGNPVITSIRERGVSDPEPIILALAQALAHRFGPGPVRAPGRALVAAARKPSG